LKVWRKSQQPKSNLKLRRFANVMKVFSHSEPGGHETNEDAIRVTRYADDPITLICALSDGQGGQVGGALAAQTAVDSCLEKTQTYSLNELLKPFTWQAIGAAVDRNVLLKPDAGYTTFIGLALVECFVVGVSCGDSAVALLLRDKFVQLTEHQHKDPPIGSGAARLAPFSARLGEPWKLLLMSDGVWKYTGWEAIVERYRAESGQALISSLRDVAASNNGGRLCDDFSLILIES
jgi:serine/threonine protein phosphatase PrpC